MTKLLNLDTLPTTTEHTIRLKGVDHHMVPISVGKFIKQSKLAKKIDEKGDIADQFDSLIGMVDDSFPTIGRPVLEGMSFDQLNAIFSFMTATSEAGAVAAVAEGASEGK